MSADLTDLLKSWPFDSENPTNNFRRVRADDGRMLIQVREPLGIQQLEYDDRPDGEQPGGHVSWLDSYEHDQQRDADFALAHEDCLKLMQEGILFYQRYLILYQMEDWEGVVRDTDRNIGYFDLIKNYAIDREDSMMIEQYRPYVMRMNAIAKSQILRQRGEDGAAADLLKMTLINIRALEPVSTPVFKMEVEKGAKHLEQLIAEFDKGVPESRLDQLKRRQTQAVSQEDFELAARLRDEIRSLEASFSGKN